jgi:hypothetical protein
VLECLVYMWHETIKKYWTVNEIVEYSLSMYWVTTFPMILWYYLPGQAQTDISARVTPIYYLIKNTEIFLLYVVLPVQQLDDKIYFSGSHKHESSTSDSTPSDMFVNLPRPAHGLFTLLHNLLSADLIRQFYCRYFQPHNAGYHHYK